jgi:sigma-B regulation protein RsbU (phosphoserine phosphatase)
VDQGQLKQVLARSTIFGELAEADLAALAERVHLLSLAAGDWLFQQGDLGDACYVVATGLVRLVVGQGSAEETHLGLLGPGGFFGELSLIEPEGRRGAGALALEACTLLTIPAAAFDGLLRQHPAVALNVLRRVAANQRRADARAISDLRQKNAELTAAYAALEAAQSEALRRARVARELELARDLQASLLPSELPNYPGLRCSAASFPAFEMSGDFFDARIEGASLTVLMADVADKGAKAALVMALTKGLLLATPEERSAPLDVVQRANRLLCATGVAGAVVTLVYATLDLERHMLRFVRAGHEWPLHYQRATGLVSALEAPGMPLGIDEDALLEEGEAHLHAGDALVFYTDGLTEARSPWNEEYQRERLMAAVRAYGHLPAQAMAEALLGDVRAWQGSAPPNDDLTLLVVQLREPGRTPQELSPWDMSPARASAASALDNASSTW